MSVKLNKAYQGIIDYRGRNIFILGFLLILEGLSFVYLAVIKLLRYFSSRNILNSRALLVSVGNITWGGTGKTPVVIEIIRYLQAKELKVALIHHGAAYNDEVKMLLSNLKDVSIMSGLKKKDSLKKANADNTIDAIVLDDGYQQWGIKKNIDLLCLNYRLPLGNRHLIPRGSLREDVGSISRADIILINKTPLSKTESNLIKQIREYNKKAPVLYTRYRVTEVIDALNNVSINIETLKNKNVALLTAVADPDYVKDTLKSLGVLIDYEFIYPDHYAFTKKDILEIKNRCKNNIDAICVTEKDYAKLKEYVDNCRQIFFPVTILVIKIKLEFLENAQALFGRLDILLDSIGS